jgi:hypothetical protein
MCGDQLPTFTIREESAGRRVSSLRYRSLTMPGTRHSCALPAEHIAFKNARQS